MKKLVTISDIRKKSDDKCNVIYIDLNTLITPAAKDLAAELGIEFKVGSESPNCSPEQPKEEEIKMENLAENAINNNGLNITEDLINRIVQEVLKNITIPGVAPQLRKECDPSGIRLIRGDSVVCDKFDTGNPKDKVGIKEILNIKESPNMATGFMEIEKTSFDWTLGYDELDYIVEGTLDITIDGKTYRGHAGDVFYIPMNSTITFSSPDYCKFFFSTYPANWQDLCGQK